MLLEYPSTGSVTTSITLKDPIFGDSLGIDNNTIVRENRHGETIVFKDGDWASIQTNHYSIQTLTKTTIDAFKTFLDAVTGLQLKLTDYNDDIWLGYIISSANEIITQKDTCSYDVSFDFMGEKQ